MSYKYMLLRKKNIRNVLLVRNKKKEFLSIPFPFLNILIDHTYIYSCFIYIELFL